MADDSIWPAQRQLLGEFIRSQRRLAKLSLRDLAARASVSNPYLSQLERGLHDPSLRVVKAIAEALDLSADLFLAQAGLLGGPDGRGEGGPPATTEEAIGADSALTADQKLALLAVYRSYRDANRGR